MTAMPVVESEQVSPGDFLILAIDDFWNHMSNDDAVHCVSLWIDAQQRRSMFNVDGNEMAGSISTSSAEAGKSTMDIHAIGWFSPRISPSRTTMWLRTWSETPLVEGNRICPVVSQALERQMLRMLEMMSR